jgi:hypothetical protein
MQRPRGTLCVHIRPRPQRRLVASGERDRGLGVRRTLASGRARVAPAAPPRRTRLGPLVARSPPVPKLPSCPRRRACGCPPPSVPRGCRPCPQTRRASRRRVTGFALRVSARTATAASDVHRTPPVDGQLVAMARSADRSRRTHSMSARNFASDIPAAGTGSAAPRQGQQDGPRPIRLGPVPRTAELNQGTPLLAVRGNGRPACHDPHPCLDRRRGSSAACDGQTGKPA